MSQKFHWVENSTSVCYESLEAGGTSFCGEKDDCHMKGMVLPLFLEVTWPWQLRAVLYLIGLLYSFFGIAIVSDLFMGAVEKITSATKQVKLAGSGDDEPDVIEMPVWNGTVANLTLMALGSSAPEICLAIIGVIGNNFESDALGPGTIVGSAAFNLLAISAVCIFSIPSGETRRIENFVVFCITASFSLFAYIWLVIVLKVSSPDKVDIWEAVLTFLFFPILVCIAYAGDKGYFNKLFCQKENQESAEKPEQLELGETEAMLGKNKVKGSLVDIADQQTAIVGLLKDIRMNKNLSEDEVALLAAEQMADSKTKSLMYYRIGSVRSLTGGRRTWSSKLSATAKSNIWLNGELDEDTKHSDNDGPDAIIEFHASSASVKESVGRLKVLIFRHGNLKSTAAVRIETIDGTADNTDYKEINEIITFEPMQKEKEITLEIIDDNKREPDEEFFLKLSVLTDPNVKLGRTSIMEITILDDDEPGKFQFERRGHVVKESAGSANLSIIRQNGADGDVTLKWRTKDKNAVSGKDYCGGEGEITFNHGETQIDLKIPIIDDMECEKDEQFEVELYEANNGAELGKQVRTVVTIVNDDEFNGIMNKLTMKTRVNLDRLRVHNENYAQQFKDAMVVNGGDVEGATTMDYIMHVITFPFKLIFAIIPPPGMAGGYPCFIISLAMIGMIVIVVGDLAQIFGCLVGLKDDITAITFVALGTSLPDTFASKIAAINEKTADNSIGNVTGSNSVNVFMGLGLPWIIASIYHEIYNPERGFQVEAGTLSFSVIVYTCCAITAVIVFMARRFLSFAGNAELGGPNVTKYLSALFFIFLWLLYVVLSVLQSYGHINSPF